MSNNETSWTVTVQVSCQSCDYYLADTMGDYETGEAEAVLRGLEDSFNESGNAAIFGAESVWWTRETSEDSEDGYAFHSRVDDFANQYQFDLEEEPERTCRGALTVTMTIDEVEA